MDGSKKVTEEPKAAPAKVWDPRMVFDINQQAFQCWARSLSTLTEHMSQFAQARLREDIDAWGKLTACRDPGQWLECQREYVEKSTSDYLSESSTLARLALDIASEGFSALRSERGNTLRTGAMASA